MSDSMEYTDHLFNQLHDANSDIARLRSEVERLVAQNDKANNKNRELMTEVERLRGWCAELKQIRNQPADKWIRLSDSGPDFDEAGNAWLCRWVEHLEAWEVDLETYNDVFEGLSGRVREVFVGAYWMPTGLKRPNPPAKVGDDE